MPNQSAKIARLVRRIYEQRPYPSTSAASGSWSLVPVPWIGAVCNRSTNFRKILIAGCGTGDEAFRMRRAQSDAEIVAVDFSRRSIGVAERLQNRNRRLGRIRFEVADLATARLSELAGQEFDFISCHGVLSYIPGTEAALRNLAGCLRPNGVLYVGVNGLRHHSVGLRETLPRFGFDITGLQDDSGALREVLELCDEIAGRNGGAYRVAKFKPELLAGDVFGPFILNLSLRNWVQLARRAGLHFRGSYYSWRHMRSVVAADEGRLLMPRSRAEICRLADSMYPQSFHRMLFTPEPEQQPPWQNAERLMRWSPQWTGLYRGRIPKPRRAPAMTTFRLTNRSTNTRLDWHLPQSAVEVLRKCDGQRSLGEILDGEALSGPKNNLRRHLYVLHQLLVITLLSPNTNGARARLFASTPEFGRR